MDDGRPPVSFGDRLHVVALVCGVAAALVLVTNLVYAFVASVPSGAAESPLRQRLITAAGPADLTLGVLVLVAAAALALGRWFDGDRPAGGDGVGNLVVVGAGTVAVLAAVGMFADILWRFDGAAWGWYLVTVGERTATAALGGLAVWLARPPD